LSEIKNDAYAKACQEIEKLQLENNKFRKDWLEATDALMSYTGLPGQMQRIDVEQSKAMIVNTTAVSKTRSQHLLGYTR
jgi:hypothetical protein